MVTVAQIHNFKNELITPLQPINFLIKFPIILQQ